jgi:hypothetical protein
MDEPEEGRLKAEIGGYNILYGNNKKGQHNSLYSIDT